MRIRTLRFAVRRSQLALLRTEGGWSYLFQTMQASARRKKGIGPKTLQVLALEVAAPHPSENYGRLLSPLKEAHKKRYPAHFASARLGADPSTGIPARERIPCANCQGSGSRCQLVRSDEPLGTAFAYQQHANALQQFHGRQLAFRQPAIGKGIFRATIDRARKQQRRSMRRNCLDLVNQFCAAEFWHHEVGKHQINSTTLHGFQSMLRIGTSEDAIAAGLEHNFSNGERAFVVVHAKNGALGFHKPRWAFSGVAARWCPGKPVSRGARGSHPVASYNFFTPERLACPDSTTVDGVAQVLRRSIVQKSFSAHERTKQHQAW